MSVELVPATADHAHAIAENARPADIAELWAIARVTPLEAMLRGINLGGSPAVALLDGEPVAMFGVTPYSILRGWGVPWMVGSSSLDTMTARKELLRQARRVFAEWTRRYVLLFNAVDARNTEAIRWLRWIGFELGSPEPAGHDGELFIPFRWKE